ncbi:MAG: zinc ribbon domain-containing protein [Candidatus Rifleibacteriota bacterium]
MEHKCQSCSMPMKQESDHGTEKDGNRSEDYCQFCMKNGKFLVEMCLDDYIQHQADIAVKKFGMPRAKALNMAQEILPTLKRWKN